MMVRKKRKKKKKKKNETKREKEEVLAEEGSLEVMTDFEGLRWFQEAKRHLGFDGWQNKAFGVPCEWRKEVNG